MRWKVISSSSIFSFPFPHFLSVTLTKFTFVTRDKIWNLMCLKWYKRRRNIPLGSVRLVYSRTSLPAILADTSSSNQSFNLQLNGERIRKSEYDFTSCALIIATYVPSTNPIRHALCAFVGLGCNLPFLFSLLVKVLLALVIASNFPGNVL